MSYTNHLKTITDALHSLLISEFKIKVEYSKDFRMNFGQSEYISYWCTEQNLISTNTDGEDREYVFEIFHYFDNKRFDKKLFDEKISERVEQLKQLVMENKTYQPGDVYKWHDAELESIGIEHFEDEEELPNIYFIQSELHLRRFNEWA